MSNRIAVAMAVFAAACVAYVVQVDPADTIITTAGQTPEATAAAMRSLPKNNWVSIEGEASSVPDGVLAPGGLIRGVDPEGYMASCTIGPALRGDAVLTAGHCGLSGTPRLSPDGTPIGAITRSQDTIPASGPVIDAAVVELDVPLDPLVEARVAGLPVAGVMRKQGIYGLPAGTPVCFDGVKSGLKCGPLINADAHGIQVDVDSLHGDSGSPVFLVDGETHIVTIIGVLKGSPLSIDSVMRATYLDTALTEMGATALVDPLAAASVAGDPRYSTRVSSTN